MINSSRCDFSAYKVRKLQEGETIKSFDCGDEDLNDFILNNANAYHEAMFCFDSLCNNSAFNNFFLQLHKVAGVVNGEVAYLGSA